ncbi:MAG: helix-turn-helix transcriptional regulator [Deltaproteobacteria bacterium]
MKIDRLVSILVILLRKERISAKELSEMFDVSVRTILRDVEAINLAGIPIVTYQGSNGGISIAEGYRLDKSVLNADDMAMVITALKGIEGNLSDSRHKILMEKLKNTLSKSQLQLLDSKLNQFIIDVSPWGVSEQQKNKVSLIRKAIEEFKEIQFDYTDSNGQMTSRKVEPYSLFLKAQKWYLYAWCTKREDFRFFKISRTKNLVVLNTTYKKREISHEDIAIDYEWNSPKDSIEIELLFEKEMKSIVEDWFGAESFEDENGRITVKTFMLENNWLYGFILSFGTGVEVINPPHIRKILGEIAEGIKKKYS